MDQGSLFTAGYAGFGSSDKLLQRLRQHGVQWVADVRSAPFSKHFPWASQGALHASLQDAGFGYVWLGRELGARQSDPVVLLDCGYLDFEVFAVTDLFRTGIARIRTGLAKGFSIALLCAEKEPMDCHRCILIGRALSEAGVPVRHLLPDRSITQRQVEAELLAKHFRDEFAVVAGRLRDLRPMRSMLGLPSVQERVAEAYRRQNLEMGQKVVGARAKNGRTAEDPSPWGSPLP